VPVGPAIRARLGRWEIPAADLYRSFFVNLDDCATLVASLFPVRRILEVGCGDGSFAQRLLERYPDARYEGIDIAPEPGRLFRGDYDRASFRSMSTGELRARGGALFDLVVLVDVVHHVPPGEREQLFRDVQALTAPGGHYVVKEWEPTRTVGHIAAWVADRYVTGDRIEHLPPEELKQLLGLWLGDEVVVEARVPPRRNNYLVGYRR
jgi:2-polyprenyl-6-hydroxyphenyl methylase/3-demethylubiquinone-9 3-methyltransferase